MDGGVTNAGVLQNEDLHDCGVQRVRVVDRRGTTLNVVNVRAFISDDQCALKLPHGFRVDTEVGLKRDLNMYARRHIDKRATRPGRGVQRCKLVVTCGNRLAKVLLEQFRVLTKTTVGIEEDNALGFEVFLNLLVDDLGLILGGDTRDQTLLLRIRDPQTIVGVANVLRKVFPGLHLTVR